MLRKSSFNELQTFILVFGLAVFLLFRGLFWFAEQEKVLNDSPFYIALHEIMPIWVWGIIAMILSLILASSAWFIPRQKVNNVCNTLMLIGGLGNAILYFLMTSASIYNSINWLSTAQFSVLTVVCGAIGFMGGAEIYDRRH